MNLGLVLSAAVAVASASSLPTGWAVQTVSATSIPRAAHQATLLDAGLVLLTGGCSGVGCTPVERSAELIDGRSGQATPTGAMGVVRVAHAATRLGDGRVLVVGGWTGSTTTASAEAFDPRAGRFARLADMTQPRMDATLTPLAGGGALVAGGAVATNRPLAAAEIFDQNRFTAVAPMHEPRAHHAAVRLADGRVLLVGGQIARGRATASAEIFDPATKAFSATGSMQQARCKHAAVLLADGRVMVIAGSADCGEQRRIGQTEIYDPGTGRFSPGPALQHPRYKLVSAVAVTPEGEVVVAGEASDVEVWVPGAASFVKAGGALGDNFAFSTATVMPDGAVLVTGGYDDDIRPTTRTWVVGRGQPVRPGPQPAAAGLRGGQAGYGRFTAVQAAATAADSAEPTP